MIRRPPRSTLFPYTTLFRSLARPRERLLPAYLFGGVLFGIVLTKGELVSWYRIEEALRFKGPYLYLVFASALAVAAPGFALLERSEERRVGKECRSRWSPYH